MTKLVITKVQSGMCNRIIPFITSLRLSKLLNSTFYLLWDNDCRDTAYYYKGEKTRYEDMFNKINDVNYIDNAKLTELLNKNKNHLTINYCQTTEMMSYSLENLQKYDIIFFNNYVHPICTKDDNIYIKTYGTLDYLHNINYCNSLYEYFCKLKPVKELQNLINEVSDTFPNKKDLIGIHVRHWPRNPINHIKELSQEKPKEFYKIRINLMKNEINKNPNIKFFISTTDKKELNNLMGIFKDRIIYFRNRLGNDDDDKFYLPTKDSSCNKYKNLNGIVDMFLLSQCPIIYIEKDSSYSVCAKFFNKDITVKYVE